MFSLTAVLLLLAVCITPVVASGSEGASVSGTYDVYLAKGQDWTTNYTYTGTLSPAASVLYSASEITTSSTGWSSGTTGTTVTSSGSNSASGIYAGAYLDTESAKLVLDIRVGSSCTVTTAYVGVKLTTVNPAQSAYTFFRIHVLGPSFTKGYEGGNLYQLQNVNQVPAVSLGNGSTYTSVEYSISVGSNGKTLEENTKLSFNTETGAISGTVRKVTPVDVTYTVTARMKTPSDYPGYQEAVTTVTIATYSMVVIADDDLKALKNKTKVSVSGPAATGLPSVCTGGTYSLNGSDPVAYTIGVPFYGLTVSADGSFGGIPSESGSYVITQDIIVPVTGQTGSKKITLYCEEQVAVAVDSAEVTTYTGAVDGAGTVILAASHTETDKVAGKWSVSGSSLFTIGTDGVLKTNGAVPAGTYTLTVKYTSDRLAPNNASRTVKVHVDSPLALSSSDADGVLYAATSFEALDNGQDSAVFTQTATTFGPGGVAYSVSCDTLPVGNYVSIAQDGTVSIAETIPSAKVGSHTVTVTCTDAGCPENTVSTTFTLTVVAALVVGTPVVGGITSS